MLFIILSEEIVKNNKGQTPQYQIRKFISNIPCDVSVLQTCNHSEADTRKTYVRTVDSDVVVLAIHVFATFGFSELWVCFGIGKTYVIFLSTMSPPSLDLPGLWHSHFSMP